MTYKTALLIFCFIAFNLLSFAQQVVVKGLVFEKGKSNRIENAVVTNKATKQYTTTDEWGNFEIATNIGDTLLFSKPNFDDVSKAILVKQNLIIYLTKAIALQEVVVKEQSKKAQQQEILDGFRSKGVFYNGNPPILAYIFSPLTALNELIGKDANNAQRFGNYIQRENAESNVDRHFNTIVIKKAIDIPDKDIVEFMYLYRPKPADVQYWNYYDDMNYIKKSYAEFLKRKKDFKD
ncbi:carboxypeptidase-like regulatory domain-containing protein [Pedobacter alpinus]|uniref:Carboxypeptidase-like regulatory domain-containing protein n=1 Tax=Pedobacter alpinus TaxID=1590643 RepID=A0ABW5TSZ4_9SPHI